MGIADVIVSAHEEQDVGLDTLRVENSRRQSQDCMEVAFVHEVDANPLAVAVSKKDVIRQDDNRSAAGLETAIKVLDKVQLLVARRKGEVVACSTFAAFLSSKWRIAQDEVEIFHGLADFRERVTESDFAVESVQHFVHQREAVSVVDEFAARESKFRFKELIFLRQVKEIISVVADVLRGGNHKAEGAASRVLQRSPDCGFMSRTITSIRARGVKYCPAPDFFSLAFFRVGLHKDCRDLLHVLNTSPARLYWQ